MENKLQELMNDKNLTPSILDSIIGYHYPTSNIKKLLNDYSVLQSMSVGTLLALAQALEVEPVELLSEDMSDFTDTNLHNIGYLSRNLKKRCLEKYHNVWVSAKFAKTYLSVAVIEEQNENTTVHMFRFKTRNNLLVNGNYYRATANFDTKNYTFEVKQIFFDKDVIKAKLSEAVLNSRDSNEAKLSEAVQNSEVKLSEAVQKTSIEDFEIEADLSHAVVNSDERSNRKLLDDQTKLPKAVSRFDSENSTDGMDILRSIYDMQVKVLGSLSDYTDLPRQRGVVIEDDELSSGGFYKFFDLVKNIPMSSIRPSDFYDLSKEVYRPITNGAYKGKKDK